MSSKSDLQAAAAMAISFLPSQLASDRQTPLPYTGNPRQLFLADLILCGSHIRSVFGIFLPWRLGAKADKWDELYPSLVNIKTVVLHIILVITQLIFLLSLPFFLFTPTFWFFGYISAFTVFNGVMCKLINGNLPKLEPSQEVLDKLKARGGKDHSDEYWIYLNGVSVGKSWLQSNIDRLSLTFGRKVYGVPNPTDGIVWDLIQCLVQRNLSFATNDIREAYVSVKKALYDEKVKKVVFLLHSQGALEGGQIIDWLLQEVPQDIMCQMEVYTFGNAANHFNNPQRAAVEKPGAKRYTPKAIGHIEHYANLGDFVAKIGVLHYAASDPAVRNRFMGRLFVSPNSGHLLNQHYLRTMFPLGPDEKCLDHNEFMDMDVNITQPKSAEDEREATGIAELMNGNEITFIGDINSPVSPLTLASPMGSMALDEKAKPIKVKQLSRLWLYRNGQSPPDDYVRRAATT